MNINSVTAVIKHGMASCYLEHISNVLEVLKLMNTAMYKKRNGF